MDKPILQLENVFYRYPKSTFSLKCSSLNIYPGECAVICGSNGSGKTTLGKLLCGILRPDQGTLLIHGENANKKSLGWIGKKVGYLFQEPSHQLFATTVLEEMTFISKIQGVDPQLTNKLAMSLLNSFLSCPP